MTKQELAAICIARLKAEYPDSDCTLDYDHAWQLLVSVRLAAQCTDARVNVVVQELFAKYPGVKELAAADPADIEAIVKPPELLGEAGNGVEPVAGYGTTAMCRMISTRCLPCPAWAARVRI